MLKPRDDVGDGLYYPSAPSKGEYMGNIWDMQSRHICIYMYTYVYTYICVYIYVITNLERKQAPFTRAAVLLV